MRNVMDRRAFGGAVLANLLAFALDADAQLAPKVWRIGYLGNTPTLNPAFEQAMIERGYVAGTNVVFERRFADGHDDRYPALAAELVGLKVDILVTLSGLATDAAKAATATIPIVMCGISDPVGRGLVSSLARPGGNITGVANMLMETNPKRIEMIKAAIPNATRVVVLANSGGFDPAKTAVRLKEEDASALALGVTVRRVEINAPSELEAATSAIVRERPDALVLGPVPLTFRLRREIAQFALKQRLPTIAWQRDQVLAGMMMSYGPSNDAVFRDAAGYVDKILKGTKASDLPIEQPTRIELIINLKTAKALGVAIPQPVMLRATEVID